MPFHNGKMYILTLLYYFFKELFTKTTISLNTIILKHFVSCEQPSKTDFSDKFARWNPDWTLCCSFAPTGQSQGLEDPEHSSHCGPTINCISNWGRGPDGHVPRCCRSDWLHSTVWPQCERWVSLYKWSDSGDVCEKSILYIHLAVYYINNMCIIL